MNRLYFGDNLKWLSDRKVCQSGSDFPGASVDLVYVDPRVEKIVASLAPK